MQIVVDKSYLQGVSAKSFKRFYEDNTLLMPTTLFYEIMTTKLIKRLDCFRTIPAVDSPFVLLQDISVFYLFEVETHKKWTNSYDLYYKEDYDFNSRLCDPNFELRDEDLKYFKKLEDATKKRTRNFIEAAKLLPGFFPSLHEYEPSNDNTPIVQALDSIYHDKSKMIEIYRYFENKSQKVYPNQQWPRNESIREDWAIYRWLQIRLIAEIKYVEKYGTSGRIRENLEKMENELLDLEYLFFACLFGALASNDKEMIERFKILRPDGRVFT